MAKLQATLRALATDAGSLAELGSRVNAIFHRDRVPGRFTTLAYLEIGANSGEVRILNAGHQPPVVVGGGRAEEMAPVAPAIGLLPDAEFEEQRVALRPGETLVTYSDGLTEARNADGGFFGEERLLELLSGAGGGAEGTGRRLLDAVASFVGEERPADDLSLIVLTRT
jgi:sigma-B regulation protein RsbU (phosphoserine phosphatase)